MDQAFFTDIGTLQLGGKLLNLTQIIFFIGVVIVLNIIREAHLYARVFAVIAAIGAAFLQARIIFIHKHQEITVWNSGLDAAEKGQAHFLSIILENIGHTTGNRIEATFIDKITPEPLFVIILMAITAIYMLFFFKK